MKKFFVIIILASICCGAFAQDNTTKDTSMMNMKHMKKDCAMMKNSSMQVRINGHTVMMDNPFKLNNGGMVMTDGTVKLADGTTRKLKEGQYIDIDGKIGIIKNKMKKNNTGSDNILD